MKAVSLSLSRLEGDLQMAGKATGTIQQYLASARGFEAFLCREMALATPDEIRGWVEYLRQQPIGAARLRCHYSALTFLFRKTLGQPEKVAFISMPRNEAPLPVVLTSAEVQRVLGAFTTAKYRTFCTLLYAKGLRIREAARRMSTDPTATHHPTSLWPARIAEALYRHPGRIAPHPRPGSRKAVEIALVPSNPYPKWIDGPDFPITISRALAAPGLFNTAFYRRATGLPAYPVIRVPPPAKCSLFSNP